MRAYEIALKSDFWIVKFKVFSDDLQGAINQILEAEKAPASAVLWARAISTQKAVRKTKSLLRGIQNAHCTVALATPKDS